LVISARWLGRGGFGLALVAICWPLNWTLSGPRTAYLFFPLWLGYILIVDCLVQERTGSSIWTRSRRQFVLLFVLSAPAWWLFEVINWRTRNWEYLGGEIFTWIEYHALSTISFSTVMPAVFETAEWIGSFTGIERLRFGPRLPSSRRVLVVLMMTGLGMLISLLLWPRYFYPFVWTSLVLILDPLNRTLGRHSLLDQLGLGDWRKLTALSLGALICGVFWEMWNYYSFPKWIYHTPGVDFLHIFEMPLFGYLGYIPFALELYALKNLVWSETDRIG
jgi:hypothetical protein